MIGDWYDGPNDFHYCVEPRYSADGSRYIYVYWVLVQPAVSSDLVGIVEDSTSFSTSFYFLVLALGLSPGSPRPSSC